MVRALSGWLDLQICRMGRGCVLVVRGWMQWIGVRAPVAPGSWEQNKTHHAIEMYYMEEAGRVSQHVTEPTRHTTTNTRKAEAGRADAGPGSTYSISFAPLLLGRAIRAAVLCLVGPPLRVGINGAAAAAGMRVERR